MVAGRHVTDDGTVALALVMREFVGNDRSEACHSYEFGREWGWCQCPSEPPSIGIPRSTRGRRGTDHTVFVVWVVQSLRVIGGR